MTLTSIAGIIISRGHRNFSISKPIKGYTACTDGYRSYINFFYRYVHDIERVFSLTGFTLI